MIIGMTTLIVMTTVMYGAANSLVVGIESEPRTLDPRYASDANAQYINDLSHCALISFDAKGTTKADLARSWKWIDPTTLAFELRTDARFADGSLVTVEDVMATFEFLMNTDVKNLSPLAGDFRNIRSLQKKSSSSFIVKFIEADVSFINNFMIGILPKKIASHDGPLGAEELRIGCGPFRLSKSTIEGIELESNPHYTLSAKPKLTQISFKIVKDEQTRYAKIRKGELDLVQNGLSRDKLVEIAKSQPQLSVYRRAAINTSYLGFNVRDPILAKSEVRQAISMAINRDEIIKYLLQGYAIPAKTMLPPGDPYLNTQLSAPKHDPKKAAMLLDQAGWKDPEGNKPRFELSYKTTTDTTRVAIAQAIAGQLSKVGIKVNIQAQEWGKFKDDVEKGQVQLWSLAWVGFKDPDIYRHAFSSEKFPPNGGNRGWYSNSKLDLLLTKAKGLTDVGQRTAVYHEIQSIVAAETPYAFLWHEDRFIVAQKSITGIEVFADGRLSSLTKASR